MRDERVAGGGRGGWGGWGRVGIGWRIEGRRGGRGEASHSEREKRTGRGDKDQGGDEEEERPSEACADRNELNGAVRVCGRVST